ncbi:MAG TPA: LamG-like jellyroll fold domain-containing protein [Candidatus Dormibacteraeota bacterium]|nr:LamG-like jellyroll fold domain-containing protein [Candidatus Dormibacteraeota bacterium]
MALVTNAQGGFTASVLNTLHGPGTGTLVNSVLANASSCASTADAISSDSTNCPAPLLDVGTIPATGTLVSTAVETNGGSISGTGNLTAASCGAVGLVDDLLTGTNPGLLYYGVNLSQPGDPAIAGQTSVDFNGTTGFATTATAQTFATPATFTIAGWFKTAATVADTGTILSFSGEQDPEVTNPAANAYDKYVYIDKANSQLYFMIDKGGTKKYVTVTTALAASTWYFFTASDSAATRGLSLQLDNGTAVAKTQANTADLTGYWTLGYGYGATALKGVPYSDYLNGSLSDVAIFPTVISAAEQTALYGGGTVSQSTYASDVVSDGAGSYWPLNDTGSYIYPDAVPGVTTPATTFPDATGNGNPGTPVGGATAGGSGVWSDGAGASLDGTTGYVETATAVNPQVVSESAWFKTTTSGAIMGMTSVQTNGSPAEWDRMLWVDPAGHVVYGIYPGGFEEVTSPGAYDDGAWHFVVATVGPAGQDLYVDGALVASNAAVTAPQNYVGYWHLGFAYTASWPDAPTSDYLDGSIADAAVFDSQLAAAKVNLMYRVHSQGGEYAATMAMAPTSFWTLGESPSGVCALAETTISEVTSAATICVVPAGAGACPALAATSTLSTLSDSSFALATLGSGGLGTLTTTMQPSGAIPAAAMGVHLTLPLYLALESGSWNASTTYLSESLVLE